MYRKKRLRRRERHILTDISMTPLIDTVLVLLVIFMVATPVVQHAIKVSLPSAKMADALQQQSVQEAVIYINKDNELYFNNTHITMSELTEHLKNMSAGEQRVLVHADQGVPYGKVVELVDVIKWMGGVKYVALATQKSSQ